MQMDLQVKRNVEDSIDRKLLALGTSESIRIVISSMECNGWKFWQLAIKILIEISTKISTWNNLRVHLKHPSKICLQKECHLSLEASSSSLVRQHC